MAAFETDIQVGFEHADVAGVVYYPRYFEMLSKVVERWFQEGLGCSYRQMHLVEKRGIPLVEVHCRFAHPSFLSDMLHYRLEVTRLGRRSVTMHIEGTCNGEPRIEADMTIVHTRLREGGMGSEDLPADLTARMREFVRPVRPNGV